MKPYMKPNEASSAVRELVMKRYMKPHDAGSAVRWFFFLFSVNTLVLAASLLILEAIIVSP